MDQPVTTNPIIIMMINMTVVFAVLWGLSLIVRLIHIIDPTRKKEETAVEAEALQKKTATVTELASVAETDETTSEKTFVLVAAALAAYGCKDVRIVSIRPVKNPSWTQAARLEAVQNNQRVF